MTLRLLSIANPRAYTRGGTDVPLGYARLAAHPEISLFHVDTEVLHGSTNTVDCVPIPPDFRADAFYELAAAHTVKSPIASFDLAFCRSLKPFPQGYLDHLVRLSAQVPFFNDPGAIRRQLDPSFLLDAAGAWLPEHGLAESSQHLEAFLDRHQTIVAKLPNSCGGRGVFRIGRVGSGGFATDNAVEGSRHHPDLVALWGALRRHGPGPLLLMRYLPRVREGEKRLVVVDGEIQGAYMRRSPHGHWVQNVSQGAQCEPVAVSEADREVVEATSGAFSHAGIRLLGYDLIRDVGDRYLVSEINAGNVGGLFRLESLSGLDLTDRFVAALRAYSKSERYSA